MTPDYYIEVTRTIDSVPLIIKVNPSTDTIEFSMGMDFSYIYISRPGLPGVIFELADGDKAVFYKGGTR